MIFLNALKDTINPKGGNGVWESIIVLALICAVTLLAFYGKEVPDALMLIVTAIAGVIGGYKIGGNKTPEKGDKNDV